MTPRKTGKYAESWNFNSHAHVERDTSVTVTDDSTGNFNSHAHVERDNDVISKRLRSINFNSHAHVERDFRNHLNKNVPEISTHTLTWSVTG